MKQYLLDKVISEGTLYRSESDKALIIEKIGTNSSSKVTFSVAGSPVAEIINTFAPLTKVNTNLCGPFALGPNYIVVPQDKTFKFEGASGSYCRIIGRILEFEPDEALPSDYKTRYTEQGKRFISYQSGSYSSSAGASISAGQEETIMTFTCPTGERWTFNSIYMGEVYTTGGTIAREALATRIYVDDKPFDIVETESGPLGIYSAAAPYPPREDVNYEAFSLEAKPIVLEPGHTLKVTWINTGSAATLASDETLEARVLIVGVKEYL